MGEVVVQVPEVLLEGRGVLWGLQPSEAACWSAVLGRGEGGGRVFRALWKVLEPFAGALPWSPRRGAGAQVTGRALALQSTGPQRSSWMFSPLSPGRRWFAVQSTAREQPGEAGGPHHVTRLAPLTAALSLPIPSTKTSGRVPSLSPSVSRRDKPGLLS